MVNFHASSRKSENLHFHGLLLSKAYKYSDESREDLPVSWHWRLMQSFTKNWLLAPKMTVRNLVNFIASSDKSGNLHFYVVLLLSIAYKVLAKKVQKNYLSSHWKKIQTLKKNWLFIWKMTWGIWWTVENNLSSGKVWKCSLWWATFVESM